MFSGILSGCCSQGMGEYAGTVGEESVKVTDGEGGRSEEPPLELESQGGRDGGGVDESV